MEATVARGEGVDASRAWLFTSARRQQVDAQRVCARRRLQINSPRMRVRVAMEMGVAKSCTAMVMWMRVGVGGLCREAGWVMAGGKHERFAYVMSSSCLAATAEHCHTDTDSKPQTSTTTLLFAAPFRADDTQDCTCRTIGGVFEGVQKPRDGQVRGPCHRYRDCDSAAYNSRQLHRHLSRCSCSIYLVPGSLRCKAHDITVAFEKRAIT